VTTRLLAIVLFAFSTTLCALPNASESKPEDTVEQYCSADSEGARTRSETFSRTDHLVLWHTEPGWDTTTLINGFKILSSKVHKNQATVVVEYTKLGELDWWDFLPDNRKERVIFHLELSDKEWTWKNDEPVLVHADLRWRIVQPVIQPHISVTYAIKHMQWLMKTAEDREHKLPTTLAHLKALNSSLRKR
jgi:hypothetical protein